MRLRNALVVCRREYAVRIRSKAFWISTIALPLLMVASMVIPALVMSRSGASQRLVVVDLTGELAPALTEALAAAGRRIGGQIDFEVTVEEPAADAGALRRALAQRVLAEEIDAWIWIGEDALETDRVEYHAESVSNFMTQEVLERALSEVARRTRLAAAGYDVDAVGRLSRGMTLETIRVSEAGSRAEGGEGGFILAVGLLMILYISIIVYGTQVMLGVLEEKSSRVVEVMLAATSSLELMSGKLAGICLVALTQLAIWMGCLVLLTTPGLLAAMITVPAMLRLPAVELSLVAHFFLHFLLGFFLFATFYAALGAAFNNQEEAQQLSFFGVSFLILPMLIFPAIINDPDSLLATVSSLIPPFTPLLMMLRIAVKTPPSWQVALAYVLTTAFCAAMVWLAARIYRTGILMYGKKPSVREIWRWVRYR